jgi:hypothetical protein
MKKRLLILADLGHLKAFRLLYNAPGLKPKLELIGTFSTTEASGRMRDKVTDSPDAKRGDVASATQGVTSDGERHNLSLEFQRRAQKQLGQQITDLVRNEADIEEWFFAAKNEINSHVLQHVPQSIRNKMIANWTEDLINIPNGELVHRVDEWEKQVQMAAV